jgi:hypothetical protein
MIDHASRNQPCVQWRQVFSVIEGKTKEVVCYGVVSDEKSPSIPILPFACTLNVDPLSFVADEIVSRMVYRHPFSILEYVTQNTLSYMNTKKHWAVFILVK